MHIEEVIGFQYPLSVLKNKFCSYEFGANNMWVWTSIKLLLLSGLGGCFIAQVWNQLEKFFRRDTTFTSTKKVVQSLNFPTISFCARNGFKFDEMDKMGLDRNLWVYQKFEDEMMNAPDAKTTNAWLKSTFELSELVSAIRCRDSKRVNVKYGIFPQDNENLTITESNNISQGRCYTIIMKESYEKKFQYLTLVFNTSSAVGAINLYLHDRGLEGTGLYWNYWAVQPYGLTLQPDTTYNLELRKQMLIRDPTQVKCSPKGATNENVNDCIMSQIANETCVTCYYPYFGHVNSSLKEDEFCSSKTSVRETMGCIFGVNTRIRTLNILY